MILKRIVEYRVATQIDLVMKRNDNPWRAKFQVIGADGQPLDMTAHTAKMQLRLYEGMDGLPNLGISVPIYSFFVDSSGNLLTFKGGEKFVTRDAPGGSSIAMLSDGFAVTINALDIAGIPHGPSIEEPIALAYDVLVTTPDGDENAWYEGRLVLRAGISRPITQDDRDGIYHAFYEVGAGLPSETLPSAS